MGNLVTQGQFDERIENLGIENLVRKGQFNQQQESIDKLSVSIFESLKSHRVDIQKLAGDNLSHTRLSEAITNNLSEISKKIARIDQRIDNFKAEIASIQRIMKEQLQQ